MFKKTKNILYLFSSNQKKNDMFKNSKKVYKQKQQEQKNTSYYPIQHAKQLNDENTKIFNYQKPARYLTEHNQVQFEQYIPNEGQPMVVESPLNSKYLEVAVVGPPNAGKSSIFNTIIGQNISSTSNKSNTTDENILGYYTNQENLSQIVLHDTPGITKNYKSSSYFVTKAWNIINECRKVIFVVDANRQINNEVRECLRRLNLLKYNEVQNDFMQIMNQNQLPDLEENQKLDYIINNAEKLMKQNNIQQDKSIPKILVVNKMDECKNRQKLTYYISEMQDLGKFDQTFFVSAKTGYGIDALKSYLEDESLLGEWQFNPKANSQFSVVEQFEQIMKSIIFSRFFHEMPYQIGVTLTEFVKKTDGQIVISFDLDVDTDDQVGMLVGYKGRNAEYLKKYVNQQLMQKYNKSFILKIRIKKRKHGLAKENNNVKVIKSPKSGQEEIQKQVDNYNQTRKQLAEKIKIYLNI